MYQFLRITTTPIVRLHIIKFTTLMHRNCSYDCVAHRIKILSIIYIDTTITQEILVVTLSSMFRLVYVNSNESNVHTVIVDSYNPSNAFITFKLINSNCQLQRIHAHQLHLRVFRHYLIQAFWLQIYGFYSTKYFRLKKFSKIL